MGKFKEYEIRNFRKLIGKDAIIAHQLLKNDIINHEYWLISSSLSEKPPALPRVRTFHQLNPNCNFIPGKNSSCPGMCPHLPRALSEL
jgi:hypothetical protein